VEEKNTQKENNLISKGVSVSGIFSVLAIAAIAVAIIFWGISLGRKYQAQSIEKKLQSVQEETSNLGGIELEAKAVAAAVENVGAINSGKSYWTTALSGLATDTTKSVELNELDMSDEGEMILTGRTNSYEGLAKFISSLRNSDKFRNVILQSATLAGDGGSAPIDFSLSATPSGTAFSK